jgi:hypothetical protein
MTNWLTQYEPSETVQKDYFFYRESGGRASHRR